MDNRDSLRKREYNVCGCNFTLVDFTRAYVYEFVQAVKRDSEDYGDAVVKGIASKFNMSHSEVRELYEIFYERLTSQGNGSPLTGTAPGNLLLLKDFGQEQIEQMADHILSENERRLGDRIYRTLVSRFNVDISGKGIDLSQLYF